MNFLSKSIAAVLLVLTGSLFIPTAASADEAPDRVFELRTYTATDGNLDKLHARFRDHTTRIFLKHGMEVVGYWTPMDEETSKNTLIYVLAHASTDAAAESWKAFIADAEWAAVAKASNADGQILANIVSVFMTPTDYSPVK